MENDAMISGTEAVAILDGMPSPDAVSAMEHYLLQLPQVDLDSSSVVHSGMCARTILIPAGTILTGALTNIDNICIMAGDISVTTSEGTQRLTGHHVIPAYAGNKRAGIAHADTWWTTIWKTDLTDITAIEDEMTNESDLLQTRRDAITYMDKPALGD